MTAEKALASALQKQDKSAEVKALQDCVKAYEALPDSYEALKAAKALLKAQKAAGDTRGQAQALLSIGELHFAMNNLDEALKNEEEALNLFESVGENSNNVKEALSQVYNKRGEVDKAPHRAKGLAALNELSRSIELADNTRFLESMDRCKRMSSVSDADIEEKLAEALQKDYLSTARLYKDTLDMEGMLPENKAVIVDKRYHYSGFALGGGIQYGPAFQCVQNAVCNIGRSEVYAPIIMPDGLDGWEYEMAYNMGILDGIIQTPFSQGMVPSQMKGSAQSFQTASDSSQVQGAIAF